MQTLEIELEVLVELLDKIKTVSRECRADLVPVSVSKMSHATIPARYKYIALYGNEKSWTRQGRTSEAISETIVHADFGI